MLKEDEDAALASLKDMRRELATLEANFKDDFKKEMGQSLYTAGQDVTHAIEKLTLLTEEQDTATGSYAEAIGLLQTHLRVTLTEEGDENQLFSTTTRECISILDDAEKGGKR